MVYVYKIEVGGVVRYFGYTNDLKKRKWQHNYLCFKKNYKKDLYNRIRIMKASEIELIPIRAFDDKVDAKRFECLMILKDYFSERQLWQSIPKISDM
jgi:predicted GIY-YIG superfamily endonuclease